MRPVIAICVGLPASGKTKFCQILTEYYGDNPSIVLQCINFDKEYEMLSDKLEDFAPELWQQSRASAIKKIEKILRTQVQERGGCEEVNRKTQNVVLVDDNFYYRSMRREIWQIARKYGCGYCQLFFKQRLSEALSLNSLREGSASVKDEVIQRMAEVMEIPDPDRILWERYTLEVDAFTEPLEFDAVLNLISQAAMDPVISEEEILAAEAERKFIQDKDRETVANNSVHQLDLLLRKEVGTVMKAASKKVQSMNVSGKQKKEILKHISSGCNSSRKNSLEKYKSFQQKNDKLEGGADNEELLEEEMVQTFFRIFHDHLLESIDALTFLTSSTKENIISCIVEKI